MGLYDGTYSSFLQGVSQQTPQERRDGQLGEQINMLSDVAAGLRRRSGVKYHAVLGTATAEEYTRVVNILGDWYFMVITPSSGLLRIYTFDGEEIHRSINAYLVCTSKVKYRHTVSRDTCFILNTDQIPTKVQGVVNTYLNPKGAGYFHVLSGAFSKTYDFIISSRGVNYSFAATTSANAAASATADWVASTIEGQIRANATLNADYTIQRIGSIVALTYKGTGEVPQLSIETTAGTTYVNASNTSRVTNKNLLPASLPPVLDGYTMAVGDLGNSAYYRYTHSTRTWREVGVWEDDFTVTNMPMMWWINEDGEVTVRQMEFAQRVAGDEDNNPMPKFVDYGLTGIGAYQSRLVLLSGSYVNMSKTTEYNQFMRTTVAEILDDDAIEVGSAALSSAQFEYAIPYNKDLVLISQNQQAVIPSNSTVLTPRNAVIYPSTTADVSLACEPAVISRSLYYTYQRGSDYYQAGELIPNSYTDAQYFNQGITDHVPLYAKGVCTSLVGSTTNNMVLFCSDTNELLVNQFIWQGDERPQMAFHKWVFPYEVLHVAFIQEYTILFMFIEGQLVVGTMNSQLNQLVSKPIPYLDLYQYVTVANGVGTLPDYVPDGDLVFVAYDQQRYRHKEVQVQIDGGTIRCDYNGTLAFGLRYNSLFILTPPFVKDQQDRVIGGDKVRVQSLRMTFKDTGSLKYRVRDVMGDVVDNETGVPTWSEINLENTWITAMSDLVIPHRTRLQSTECTIQTNEATDMNLVSTDYTVRLPQRRKRL